MQVASPYVDIALSTRRRTLLRAIAEYWREHGFSPSIQDLVLACDISSSSVVDYNLRILERNGLIRRERGTARSMRLTDVGWDASGVERPC